MPSRPAPKRSQTAVQLLEADYVDHEALTVFADAQREHLQDEGPSTVEMISATPDWAPIAKERIKRGRRRNRDVVREGWAYRPSTLSACDLD